MRQERLRNGKCLVCEDHIDPNAKKKCTFRSSKVILQQPISREEMSKLLSTGSTDLLHDFVSNRTKRKFSAYLVTDSKGKIGFKFEERPAIRRRLPALENRFQDCQESRSLRLFEEVLLSEIGRISLPISILFILFVLRRWGLFSRFRRLFRGLGFLILVLRADLGHQDLVNPVTLYVDDLKAISAVFDVVR